MVEYVFSLDDLARVRFAISPPWERAMSLRVLYSPSSAGVHPDWVRAVRASSVLERLDLRPALALLGWANYTPDFLTPPPESPLDSIAEGLELIARTPVAQVRREVAIVARRSRAPQLTDFLQHPRREVNRLVRTLGEYWDLVFAPSWPRVRALLEADIAQRARRLAESGTGEALGDLHPSVRWVGDGLRVPVSISTTVELSGRGLLLVPSAFRWTGPVAGTAEPWQPQAARPPTATTGRWRVELVVALVHPAHRIMFELLAATGVRRSARARGPAPRATRRPAARQDPPAGASASADRGAASERQSRSGARGRPAQVALRPPRAADPDLAGRPAARAR